jgi:secreted trypsin-like serine protease
MIKSTILISLLVFCFNLFADIVNGEPAGLEQFPWQVRLNKGCSGSIISSRFIVTAAHCVHNLNPNRIFIEGGDVDQEIMKPFKNKVLNVYIHERYNAGWLGGVSPADIALIQLASDIKFSRTIQPILLITKNLAEVSNTTDYGNRLLVSGWGAGVMNRYLEFIDNLRIVPSPSNLNFWNKVENRQLILDTHLDPILYNFYKNFMGGDYLGVKTIRGKSTCPGDSGGPLTYVHKNKFYLAGIVSHGSDRCGRKKMTYFVHVYKFASWIRSIVKNSDH